jgi:hypothetical protein
MMSHSGLDLLLDNSLASCQTVYLLSFFLKAQTLERIKSQFYILFHVVPTSGPKDEILGLSEVRVIAE